MIKGRAAAGHLTPPLNTNLSPAECLQIPENLFIPGHRFQGVEVDLPLLESEPRA